MKQNKGITLIALVITIIILLILAGISISLLTGENGIITKANWAKEENRAGIVDDEVKLWQTEVEMYNITEKSGKTPKTEEEMLNDLISRKLVNDIEKGNEIDRDRKVITIAKRDISYATKWNDKPISAKVETSGEYSWNIPGNGHKDIKTQIMLTSKEEAKIESFVMPDGTTVQGNSATYTIPEEDFLQSKSYTFKSIDENGKSDIYMYTTEWITEEETVLEAKYYNNKEPEGELVKYEIEETTEYGINLRDIYPTMDFDILYAYLYFECKNSDQKIPPTSYNYGIKIFSNGSLLVIDYSYPTFGPTGVDSEDIYAYYGKEYLPEGMLQIGAFCNRNALWDTPLRDLGQTSTLRLTLAPVRCVLK